MNWICDNCGDESEDENAACSCDDDTNDLLAEIRRLRDENRKLRASDTLAAATQRLRENFSKGSKCECCGQLVKRYRRKLNAAMAYVLTKIYQHAQANQFRTDDWLHVPSFINKVANDKPELAAAVRGDWAKLRHWRLIREKPETRDDGSPRAGLYQITVLGCSFVLGQATVPSHMFFYNEVAEEDPEALQIRIDQALAKGFNYTELMEAT